MFIGLMFGLAWAGLMVVGPRAAQPTAAGAFWGSAITAGAAVLAGSAMMRFVEGRTPLALGLAVSRETTSEVGLGIVIGVVSLAFAALLMLLLGDLSYVGQAGDTRAWVATVGLDLGTFAVAAFAEEALYRGYPFQVLARSAGPVAATVIASAAFAAGHAGNPNVDAFGLVNIFLAGVLLSAAYLRTRSLWFATAVHLGWNWCMASLFDLPVSGLTMFDTPGYEAHIGGARWVSGGAFGPEGGVVGTAAFALALLAVLRLRSVRPTPRMLATRPLVDDLPAMAATAQGRSQ
jgi:membrane protease YdiL (CAAX protease family)